MSSAPSFDGYQGVRLHSSCHRSLDPTELRRQRLITFSPHCCSSIINQYISAYSLSFTNTIVVSLLSPYNECIHLVKTIKFSPSSPNTAFLDIFFFFCACSVEITSVGSHFIDAIFGILSFVHTAHFHTLQ